MRLAEVLDEARARPWAAQPWARDLLDALPDRLRAVLSRWDLTVVRAFGDGAELPVHHQTRRSGRPYTLVLTKTDALFEREREERQRDQSDLAWLGRNLVAR